MNLRRLLAGNSFMNFRVEVYMIPGPEYDVYVCSDYDCPRDEFVSMVFYVLAGKVGVGVEYADEN